MRNACQAFVSIVLCMGCVPSRNLPSTMAVSREAMRAEFVGERGTIVIDRNSRTVAIGAELHPLEDCSNGNFLCLKNEEIGLHIVFPRMCSEPYQVEGETIGGFRFFKIAIEPHGHIRVGTYASALSDRFSFDYFIDRGLFQINYDPEGQVRFGLQTNGWRMSMAERKPYVYRLAADQAFLRCAP